VRLTGERAARREAHWRRVAVAATEPCGRTRVPEVRPTLGFMSWLAVPVETPRWILDPAAEPLAARGDAPSPLEILVGPEGGFSERERELLAARGAIGVSLGPRVLRAETAPVAALAAIQALWGDFSR
jgi:16S rRNA (uracil1498-N3)-methyltransferase